MEVIRTNHGRILFDETPFATYLKEVDKEKHYFRMYEGYGFSDYEIEQMRENKVNTILVLENNKGRIIRLYTTYQELTTKGEWYTDRRIGDRQRILRREHFKEVK